MRVLAVFLLLGASAPVLAADAGKGVRIVENPNEARIDAAELAKATAKCRPTTSYLTQQRGLYRGAPLTPKKLTELPQGTTYMAVFRHIGGCEAPMTMVEYRSGARR